MWVVVHARLGLIPTDVGSEYKMTLGMGIFLSALILAAVIMYALTMNRWDRRKITLRTFISIGVAVLLSAGAAALFMLKDRLLPLSVQKEYSGLQLGMTMDEVKYAIGFPDAVLESEIETTGEFKGFQKITASKDLKDKKVEDYSEWNFGRSFGYVQTTFDAKNKKLIVVECFSRDRGGACPAIYGIKDGDTEQSVLQRLSTPEKSQLDGVTKKMYYERIGVFLFLTKMQVYLLGINDTGYKYTSTK
jgi:hypothetical protein